MRSRPVRGKSINLSLSRQSPSGRLLSESRHCPQGWLRRIAALFVSQAGDRRSFACAPADRNRRKSFLRFDSVRAYFVYKRSVRQSACLFI